MALPRRIRSELNLETRAEDRRAMDYQDADTDDFVLHLREQLSFSIDAEQFHCLASRQYLSLLKLDHRVIEDRNKFDGLLRAIKLCQITWFVTNTIGPWAQQLAVTTFELMTVSSIPQMLCINSLFGKTLRERSSAGVSDGAQTHF